MKYLVNINEAEKTIIDYINRYGTHYVAKEFITLYQQYYELATKATDDQYSPSWTHSDLMKFLNDGEF